MSEVGTTPPHNWDKPHKLVESINNNKNRKRSLKHCKQLPIKIKSEPIPSTNTMMAKLDNIRSAPNTITTYFKNKDKLEYKSLTPHNIY